MRRLTRGLLIVMAVGLIVAGPASAAGAATTIKMAGSTTVQPLAQKIATAWHNKTGNTATVAGGGSGAGVACALAGTCDIGDSSRDPKSGEGGVWTPFAKDAIVIIVNPGIYKYVKNLTIDQVKAIFLTGTIRNWHNVNKAAPSRTILVYQRAATSGTEAEFKQLYLGSSNVTICCNAPAEASNGLVRSAVETHKYAIGFVSQYFDLTSTAVTGVAINGVAPTLANAKSGRFPYVRTLYFITKSAPSGAVKSYIDFALSSTVQNKIVAQYWIPIK